MTRRNQQETTTPTTNVRNVRTRITNGYGLLPYETGLVIPDFLVEVNIEHLSGENPETKKAVMYLQLIRIVSGSQNGQNNMTAYQSYYKKNNKTISSNSHYFRLFLFRDVASTSGEVVYMIEGKQMNDKLWARNPLLRDNGVLTVGSYIIVFNPLPITTRFCNEIPLLETRGGCVVMNPPQCITEIKLDHGISTGVTRVFVVNNVQVRVNSTSVQTTKCSGLFCDRQRAVEIERGDRACGCYSMQSRIGNIVIVHNISVIKDGIPDLCVEDFSSLNFSSLYLKDALPVSVKFNSLDYTPQYLRLHGCIDDVVQYVNENGGFTVVGWYKRGEINDISREDNENQVESSDIQIHLIAMYPVDRNILTHDDMKAKQFDIFTTD